MLGSLFTKSRMHPVAGAALGLGVPLLVAVVLEPANNPSQYRPGSILLLGCVVVAIAAGSFAAVLAAVTSVVVLWWALTEPYHSFQLQRRVDVFGLIIFAVSAAGVVALARLAAARVDTAHDADQVRFRSALDAMLDNVVIGSAVRSETGQIVDFLIEFTNGLPEELAKRHPYATVGRRVCELNPGWRTSGMLTTVSAVVETGRPFVAERLHYADTFEDGTTYEGYWTMQVAKFGDGYIAATRNVTDIVAAEREAQLAANLIDAERSAVELLQAAALPSALPTISGVTLSAVYEPADPTQPVGGDWYDAFLLDDDRIALVIADVSGHGREAAAFMLQVRNIFRAVAIEHALPADVLHHANEVTTRLNEADGPFVTCCYGVFQVSTGRFEWAQSGHFSPLLLRADGVAEYLPENAGPPLAIFRNQTYPSSVLILNAGDRILMFTDGMVERRREILDVGIDRLRLAVQARRHLDPQAMVDDIATSITDRFDDLAMICLAVRDSPQKRA
jgi:serine phosphatase RsbU (regulator of sigma subunit)